MNKWKLNVNQKEEDGEWSQISLCSLCNVCFILRQHFEANLSVYIFIITIMFLVQDMQENITIFLKEKMTVHCYL